MLAPSPPSSHRLQPLASRLPPPPGWRSSGQRGCGFSRLLTRHVRKPGQPTIELPRASDTEEMGTPGMSQSCPKLTPDLLRSTSPSWHPFPSIHSTHSGPNHPPPPAESKTAWGLLTGNSSRFKSRLNQTYTAVAPYCCKHRTSYLRNAQHRAWPGRGSRYSRDAWLDERVPVLKMRKRGPQVTQHLSSNTRTGAKV